LSYIVGGATNNNKISIRIVDVFSCGDKLEKAVETNGKRAVLKARIQEDILKNAVGSIEYHRNGNGNVQVL
jgi:hypothetical protein